MKKAIYIGIFILGVILLAQTESFLTWNTGTHKSEKTPISQPIKIGVALALTGDASAWGEASRNAVNMAIEDINSAGKNKFEAVFEDIKSSSKDSVSAVSKLVNVDKVQAVMITWLDSYQGSQSVVPKNIPLISQDAAIESVNVPENHENVFSLWYRTSDKARVTFEGLKKDNVKTLYVVLQNDSYYATLAEFFEREGKKTGVSIVSLEKLNPGDDPKTVISKIQKVSPDAVFFGSYDEKLSVDFIKKYFELMKSKEPSRKTLLYADEFLEQNIEGGKINPLWVEDATYYVPSVPDPDFAKRYHDRFGLDPKFSAVQTYDTVMILAKYLGDKNAGLTVVSPSDYFRNNTFKTLTYGDITFDEIGGVVASKSGIVLKKVKTAQN